VQPVEAAAPEAAAEGPAQSRLPRMVGARGTGAAAALGHNEQLEEQQAAPSPAPFGHPRKRRVRAILEPKWLDPKWLGQAFGKHPAKNGKKRPAAGKF